MCSRTLQCSNYAVSFLLVLCCSSIKTCTAQNNQAVCKSSSCANIKSISYPFRLKTDPRHCGKPGFELDCRNNQTIITFKDKFFNVQSINYSNYTIRMTDPGLVQASNFCSLPEYNLLSVDLPFDLMTYQSDFTELNNFVVFVDCLNAVNSSRYMLLNDPSCSRNSSGGYRYLTVGNIGNYSLFYEMSRLKLEDSCSVDKFSGVSLIGTPLAAGNASVAGIRRSLAYGFELSWHQVMCDVCDLGSQSCVIKGYDVTCQKNCFESTPYEEKSLECKVEYITVFVFWYGGIGILCLLVLRYFVVLCCIGVLASRERKRRRLYEMRHMNDQVPTSVINAEDISK